MCLAYPMKIVALEKETALAEVSGIRRKIGIQLLSGVHPGDYVMVHAGFAIEKVNENEAQKTLALLREYDDAVRRSSTEQKANKKRHQENS